MNNPIIANLRRIRDANARKHRFNVDAIAEDLMKLDPWMKTRTYTMHRGKILRMSSLSKKHGVTRRNRRTSATA